MCLRGKRFQKYENIKGWKSWNTTQHSADLSHLSRITLSTMTHSPPLPLPLHHATSRHSKIYNSSTLLFLTSFIITENTWFTQTLDKTRDCRIVSSQGPIVNIFDKNLRLTLNQRDTFEMSSKHNFCRDTKSISVSLNI